MKYFKKTKDRSEHNSEDEEKIVKERLEELAVKNEKVKAIETIQSGLIDNSDLKSDNNLQDSQYYKCKYCDHKTKSKKSLPEHVKVKHLNMRKSLSCDQCGSIFSSSGALRNHIRRVHENINIRFTDI